MTQLISTIAIAMGASWVSGINLYAAVATLGLLGRFSPSWPNVAMQRGVDKTAAETRCSAW